MVAPTLTLWLYAIAHFLAAAMSPDGRLSGNADYVSRAAFALVIAAWVSADAQKRQRPLCYDYDSLVFFFWPIVVPIYLFRTRGMRALLTLLCFAGIWLVVILAVGVVFFIREFLRS